MAERIPKDTAYLFVFKAYLSTDHASEATSKTIAITISKNGGVTFGNPAAGALNATEMAFGWYKAALGTGDTDTLGPLAIRGTASGIDDVAGLLMVVDTYNAGIAGIPGNANVAKAGSAIGRGICTTGGSTTSIPTSTFAPAGAAVDQFKGRIVLFDVDTTTAALRGQAATITGSTNAAAPTFSVAAMTTAPASGDTFSVV